MGANIDRATRFHNNESMTGIYQTQSDMMSRTLSENYGQKWFMTGFENLRRDVWAFKHKNVIMFFSVWTSRLITLKFLVLNHYIENIYTPGSFSRLYARHTNSSTLLSVLCTVTLLNNVQCVWMRWCVVWTKHIPVHLKRRCMNKTIALEAFLLKRNNGSEKNKFFLLSS